MNNRELKNRIKTSFENIAPDILESVLSDCEMQKGQTIVMQEKRKKNPFIKYAISMAAVLMLVFGLNIYRGNNAIATTITLDVNPSIEILVNKDEKVLDVKPLNQDAQIVVGEMDFEGSSLDVTINALIGSMLRNGYISDVANSILVSVDNNDPVAAEAMQEKLMSQINTIMESGNVPGAVLGQTVINNDEIRDLADKYGITIGKAKLIKQIIQQNNIYVFEDLVPLTINELNLISRAKLENIDSIGEASSLAYIGEQAAKDIAFKHAGINSENVKAVKCELDWENGMMVYEVEFFADGIEYEYDINALNGEIVKYDRENDDDHFVREEEKPSTQTDKATDIIDVETARSIALDHCGVSQVTDYECELDHEHGKTIYEISFKAGGYEYDYEIDASDGTVLKVEKERD